ncbi:uncharacterized protein LOC142321897 [Lycorma delicatula]|uniref:uncharacterized protein LOC142321897 n=1 Tax=Lycorma delicatula TaxID=130591 RepID=UPI003F5134B1
MENRLLQRIEGLKQGINILAGLNDENAEACAKLNCTVGDLKSGINELRTALENKKVFIEKMKKLSDELEYLNDYMDHVENNFPEELSEIMQNANIENISPKVQLRNESNIQLTSFSLKQSLDVKSSREVLLHHVSVQEFNKIHKYMRGRLTAESFNAFIDILNSVIQKKYSILKQPKNKLKHNEQELYVKWKRLEKSAAFPPGTYFCMADDFSTLINYKLDKSSFNKLVILRHIKLIKEVRCNNDTLYVVN